ncbi:MAG: A/G-specific adenine glycosylase [Bacteroidales bacterium]|nr:A/G-specific adenine glycosylase [Bacteroidales bacterium]
MEVEKLIGWYQKNMRDLPWRKTNDPYIIWISEIILQQTRVSQGLTYFRSFIFNFPSVEHLANASEEQILKAWQGLGYYSRARNLHHSAKVILYDHKGKIPSTYDDLIKLKGIGDYTASAILSIAFEKSYPVIDGNVIRVISRLFGIIPGPNPTNKTSEIRSCLLELINDQNPGQFNQAIMDFGALQCVPANPDCHYCVLKPDCYSFNNKRVSDFPPRVPKKVRSAKNIIYLVIIQPDSSKGTSTLLRKRNYSNIWKNLYEFPGIESSNPIDIIEIINLFNKPEDLVIRNLIRKSEISGIYKHELTHIRIEAKFVSIILKSEKHIHRFKEIFKGSLEIDFDDLENYPVSRLVDKYLKDVGFD